MVYVKELPGHSSIKVTADIYGHLVSGGNKEAVDRLDDIVDSALKRPHNKTGLTQIRVSPCFIW